MNFFNRLQFHWLPPVSRKRATELLNEHLGPFEEKLVLYHQPRSGFSVYNQPKEPCWFAYLPWSDDKDELMIRSSRVVLISKLTGKILYDGSAGDEG